MVSQLAHVTICWSGVVSTYIVLVGISKLATREACNRDFGLLNHLFASLGLMQVAWMMSGYEDIMNKAMLEINYGLIATAATVTALRTYTKFVRGPEPKKVDMSGKVVIITGSNTGVGYETAKSLVDMGAHVIMEDKAKAAIASIMEQLEAVRAAIKTVSAQPVTGKMTFIKLDLSSLASVRQFVADFKATKLRLDALILNAGVMHAQRKITPEGLEANLAVNYLGNFLLTTQLLPKLKESPDARVLCVNSSLHKTPVAFRFEDPMFEKDYGLFTAYANSKLALLMFAEELQHRLDREKSSVIVNSANPGIVMTDISRDMGFFLKNGYAAFRPLLCLFLKQPRAGAFTSVYSITTPSLRKSDRDKAQGVGGLYMQDSEPVGFNPAVNVVKARRELWTLSEKLVSEPKKTR